MGGWITVRMLGTGQVQEMVPYIAQQLIAMGLAVDVAKDKASQQPVTVEVAATQPATEKAALSGAPKNFTRGPITGRNRRRHV